MELHKGNLSKSTIFFSFFVPKQAALPRQNADAISVEFSKMRAKIWKSKKISEKGFAFPEISIRDFSLLSIG